MKMRDTIEYIEKLGVTQGSGLGEKFRILPWQRQFIRGLSRTSGDAALTVGRGNGKTAFLAALALSHLDGPDAIPRSEVVFAASSFSQAKIGFTHARAFLEARGEDLRDRSRWRLHDNYQVSGIEFIPNGAKLRVIGCDPRRAHGLAPVLVIADEPAQWENSKSGKMIAALRTSLGKQATGRLVALGTRPASEDHWFNSMLNGGCDYCQVHGAPEGSPVDSRRAWSRANPSARFFPPLLARIEKESQAAMHDPQRLAEFRALRLNLGSSEILQSFLIQPETWERLVGLGEGEPRGHFALGIDLGTSASMSAGAAFWPSSGSLRAMATFPREPDLQARGEADGVGELYAQMERRGELFLSGGRASDVTALLRRIADDWGVPSLLACDRWREAELRDSLGKADFPHVPIEIRGQGFRDGAADVRAFRQAVLEDSVRPGSSLLLTYAMSEARTISDPAGNSKLSKGVEGGRRSRSRDDAAAAAILAVAAGRRRASAPARAPRSFVA